MHSYYVQDIALNYRKNLLPVPDEYRIDPVYLGDADEEDIKNGCRALHALFEQLYADIETDPVAFGMMLRERRVPDAKTAEYTQSNLSLTRVPNLLYIVGVWGAPDGEGGLALDGHVFIEAAKLLKVTKAIALMQKLADYGIEFTGYGKVIKPDDRIQLACAENRHLPLALHALAQAMHAVNKGNAKKSKEPFYISDLKMLDNAQGRAPKRTIEDLCRTIDPERATIVRQFDAFIAPYAKRAVKLSGIMRNDWGCVYTLTSNKKIALTLNVNQQVLSVKMNLAHLSAYTGLLDNCDAQMRDSIVLGAWECGHCNPGCAGGFQFEYRGKAYNKCRGGAFLLEDVRTEQVEDALALLAKEIENAA